jgi:hypothetical protein
MRAERPKGANSNETEPRGLWDVTVENGGTKFYFRCRSFADIQTGKVLAERRQQKVLLATQDSSLYKNLRSSALHVKAGEIRRSIIAWEEAALNGQVVAGDGTVPAPRVEPIAPNGDITIAEFFEKVFIPAKRGLRDSGKLAAVTFETYQNYWDLFLKKHFNGTRLSATTRRGKGSHTSKISRRKTGHCTGKTGTTRLSQAGKTNKQWLTAFSSATCDGQRARFDLA